MTTTGRDRGSARLQALLFVLLLPALLGGAVWLVTRPKVVERNPRVSSKLAAALPELIGVLTHGKDPEIATTLYRGALELEPGCPEALLGLGEIMVHTGKPTEGLSYLLKYLEKHRDDAEANLWTARGYQKEGNADLAIYYFGRASDLDRESVEARKELAKLYLARRKPLEASMRLQEALASNRGKDDEELQRLMTAAMEMQGAMARDVETRGGVAGPTLGPELPDPLRPIKAATPKVPEVRRP